jgi:hypothetical protein
MHHQFASYFPAGNSWPSMLGAILSNATGANGTTWDSCPAITELELIVADWVAKMMDIPKFFWTHFSNPESEGGGCIQVMRRKAYLIKIRSYNMLDFLDFRLGCYSSGDDCRSRGLCESFTKEESKCSQGRVTQHNGGLSLQSVSLFCGKGWTHWIHASPTFACR